MVNESGELRFREKASSVGEMSLIELTDISSNLYLTHLLAVDILGEPLEHFADLGEFPWIILIIHGHHPASPADSLTAGFSDKDLKFSTKEEFYDT